MEDNTQQVPPVIPVMPTINPEGEAPVAEATQTPNQFDQGVVPPSPQREIPKPLIFGGIGILVVALLIFVISRVLGGGGSPVGGEKTVTWWGLWEDSSTVAPLIAEYEAAHPKVKIQYLKQSKEDYRERLTNALAKGQGPDIFTFHNTWVPMFKGELDSVPSSVMSAADYTQTFYPVVSSDMANGTGIAGIPLMYDGIVLYVNDNLLAEVGAQAPTTWDDLRKLALTLTKKDEQGTITQAGVALGRTENVDHWQEILALMMLQNGVDLANPTGKLAEDALTFFTLFSSEDGVWDTTQPTSTIAFASGKLAMYLGPSWRAFEIKQQNPNLKFHTVSAPQLPKSYPNESDVNYATYWVEGVWSRSKNQSQAWDFLKFISTKESLEKLYQNAARVRQFGQPYSRVDMQALLLSDPVVGAVVKQAPDAQSWYLVSRTFDGKTGINTLISKYYEDAVNGLNASNTATKVLETAAAGIRQVLVQYGLVTQ